MHHDTFQFLLFVVVEVVDDQPDLLPPVDLVLRDADQRHGVALVDVVVPVVRASSDHLDLLDVDENAAAGRRSTLMMIFGGGEDREDLGAF